MRPPLGPAPLPAGLVPFVPALSVVAATCVVALPVPLAAGALPNLPLAALIAWAGLQPRLVPPLAAFPLGLLADAVAGLPLGVQALTFLLVRLVAGATAERAATRTLTEEWLIAGLLLWGATVLEAGGLALAGRAPALGPLLVQWGLSALSYPAVFAAAGALGRRMASSLRT
ncbi:MAG: rod shape-determining protein MreD [Sphingomonadaceae bacterium]|uniref:rod shape-determining protein MreD n=1 Tax=Thermaurantiacus sp. TaxID=2820283 RepID=UPI00298EEF69|nr:rod shape-determining protein MreD [Thermaurantiacus sp.]MCS6987599.1 rod shape-determining protein MreD [Sphingomonadaceae bacterium]MDW8415200.1 rod shape-determining protein MreD [Thermaurantiacus sp.]